MRYVSLFTIAILIGQLGPSHVIADDFVLRNGRTVKGTLLNATEKDREVYRIRLDAGGDVTLDVTEVRKVISLSPEAKKYRELLAKMPSETAELHWKMAEQCRKWSLLRERKFHLEQVVRLDPDHADARRVLKHKQRADGSWAPSSKINEEAGLVRQGGRWVTRQQAQLNESVKEYEAAVVKWKKKTRLWKNWISDNRRRDQALAQIAAVDDPAAVGPLVDLFRKNSNPALRDVLAEVLAKYNNGNATQALVEAALSGNRSLRMQCIRQLQKNNRTSSVPYFVSELTNKENAYVRNSGFALGELGGEEVVLPLIKALRTTHSRYVSSGDGRIRAGGGGLTAGKAKPRKIDEVKNNKEVLSALIKLTGRDFQYNEPKWIRWYLAKTTPPNLDLRRDP